MITTGRKIYRIFSVIAVAAIMITIFILSAQDSEESTATSGFFVELLKFIFRQDVSHSLVRTAAHFCEYAGLGFFMCNVLYSFKERLTPVVSALLSWGYAWTDEIHQIFVDGRAFQLSDLAVDLGGVILGTLVFTILISLINKIINKRKTVER